MSQRFSIRTFFLLTVNHSSRAEATTRAGEISLFEDPKLSIQVGFDGLEFPSSMAILDSGEILVLHMIIGDKIIPKPLLDVNVVTTSESGMLGIVVAEHYQGSNKSYVFLYFTEAQDKDGGKSIGHRVYRYELTGGGYRERLLILITLIYMIY